MHMNNFIVFNHSESNLYDNTKSNGLSPFNEHTVDWIKLFHNTDSDKIAYQKISEALKTFDMKNLFSELDRYAAARFGVMPKLQLEIRDYTLNISQNRDTIYMNSVMSSAYFSFLLTHLYHSYLLDNPDPNKEKEELFCYRYLLFILNEMCFHDFEQPIIFPNGESIDELLHRIQDKQNLFNLASNLFYTSISFALMHEICHAYLCHDYSGFSKDKELEADRYAYEIFLDFCYDVMSRTINSNFSECIQNYTYLAPMYLLEFYYTIYYTGSFLCPNAQATNKDVFELINERKNKLFDIFYEWDRDISSEAVDMAYGVYNAYLNAEDSFIQSFVASDKAGYLNELKRQNLNMERGKKLYEQL